MSELTLPKVDKNIISKKYLIVSDLKKILKKDNILSEADEIKPYETDALAAYKNTPLAVVLPENTKEVSKILAYQITDVNGRMMMEGALTDEVQNIDFSKITLIATGEEVKWSQTKDGLTITYPKTGISEIANSFKIEFGKGQLVY